MSNVSKLKKKAADFEQKKQFDRAVQAYIELLDTLANDIDDADIPLYNRVGDLLIRQNSASEALVYYEKAVDLYSERGFLNNAIALCNKILRQSPGRTIIYYKLGKISATKGFKSDAKRNFLEYADRMEKTGKRDEAFRALKEFADLCPDQDDVRLMLAEHLARDNRKDEAIEQLQTLHAKLETEGRSAEARATLDRMKAIDPEVEPKPSGSYKIVKSNELVFLDIDDVPTPRSTPSESVPSARAPQPADSTANPASIGKSGSATLDGLDLTLVDEGTTEVPDTELIEGFTPTGEHDRVTPGAVPRLDDFDTGRAPEEELDAEFPSLIDVPAVGDDPNETVSVHGESFVDETLSETEFAALELEPLDVPIEERPHDLALPTELPLLTFTDEVATIEEQSEIVQTPITGADLDAQIMPPISRTGAAPAKAPVADLLEENAMELVEADPLTVDAAAADLEEEAATLDESMEAVPNEDYGTQTLSYLQSPEEALASDDDAAPLTRSEGSHPLEWEDLAEAAAARTVEPLQLPTQPKLDGPPEESEGEIDPNFLDRAPTFGVQETPVDAGFSPFPLSPDTLAPDESATEHRAPISEVDKQPLRAPAPAAQESVEHLTEKGLRERPQAPRAVEAKSLVQTLREQLDTTPNDPRLRRRFAEALLDAGEREQGLRELDAAMRAIELEDDLDTARDIANEILRLVPESVRHHQKCVEYAVRAGDRTQLIEAYLALADALFRGGEHSKAHAVYGRVVELEPNERRALHVLDLLAGRAPGDGALTQRLTPQAGHVRHEEPEAGDPSFEEPELEDLDAEVAAAFQSPDESGDHPHAGHGNGMRPGDGFATPAFVPSGDFIDLGAMLRGDQPEKSTRMVVGDAKPTGDEQADFEDMLRRFKQGVAANVDEEDFDSHYDLGVAFKEMGLVDDAIAQFQKALGSETHRSRAYEALGQCFVEKQQHHVAATLLKRAVETTRVDDRVLIGSLYLLGYACEHLQRDREALVYYQRVFAVDVDFRDVATRIRALESQAAS